MKVDPYKLEMADVAKELGGNLVIKYHTATISLICEQLQTIKENGFPTDIMSCVMAGFMMSGKTKEEAMAFLKEADEAKAGVSVSFDAPNGSALNVKSKEENPMMDLLVQAVEDNN